MDSKMNVKLLKELYKQAETECGWSEEKFAELIVRECVEQVWYTREDGINGNVSQVIKDRIKQHFGVES
jgi:hypothetical protein